MHDWKQMKAVTAFIYHKDAWFHTCTYKYGHLFH